MLYKAVHAAVRGLNSLADLEILEIFVEKYFGNGVENRNPALLDVVHFEEEVLRQKITWREKYEGVISGWLEPKTKKSLRQLYKPKQGRDAAAGNPGDSGDGGVAAAAVTEKPGGDAKPDGGGPVKAEGETGGETVGAAAVGGKEDPAAVGEEKRNENEKPRPNERSESSAATGVGESESPVATEENRLANDKIPAET